MTDDPRRPPTFVIDEADANALERYCRLAVPRDSDFAAELVAHLDEVTERRRRRAAELRAALLTERTVTDV